MEEKKVEIGNPVTIGQVTIIPVVKYSLNRWSRGSSLFYFGIKQPEYIIAVSPSGKRVWDINGEEIPFGEFIKERPGLEQSLSQIK